MKSETRNPGDRPEPQSNTGSPSGKPFSSSDPASPAAGVWAWGGAAITFLISFLTYLSTMAPTVSFWDAGEFIACSHILGIPHPPGTPFFVLLGRFFTLLPLGHETAWNVNFLSVISSAAAVGLLYLVIFEVAYKWVIGDRLDMFLRKVVSAGGAAAGSLALAFSDTFWFNATEAEVYGVGMLFMILISWLTLKWIDFDGKPGRGRLLLLIIYLAFLGIGIHMQTLMILFPLLGIPIIPVLFAPLTVLFGGERLKRWQYVVPIVIVLPLILTMVIYSVTLFMTCMTVGLLLGTLAWLLTPKNRGNRYLKHSLALFSLAIFIAIIGYSTHIYIPVRSMQDPAIDENNPEEWESFKGFLERKQYGEESMLKLMFTRKGSFQNQIGFHKNMGFLGFFCRQYTGDNLNLSLLPSFLGILGIIALFAREPKRGWYFFSFFAIVSAGMLLYLNFSDGTRGVKLEVRERDYFYTPAFFYFSFFVGIGVSWLLASLGSGFKKMQRPAVVTISILFAVSPAYAFNEHRFGHDRSNNYIAYDYAYNILVSCEEDGIIFTNGDNDTFPLWFLQEVEGFRKDVRVVNLSLLNTHWYIRQLKHREPKVRINIRDEDIGELPMGARTRDGDIVRLQDFMIAHISRFNSDKPVYFAITVPRENRKTFEKRLSSEGFVYKVLYEEVGEGLINGERSNENIYEKYVYRGLSDEAVFKNKNTKNLLNNYAAIFMQLAGWHRQNNDFESAIKTLKDGIEAAPPNHWQVYGLLAQYQYENKEVEAAISTLKDCLARLNDSPDPYEFLVTLLLSDTRHSEAFDVLNEGLKKFPESPYFYQALFKLYVSGGKVDQAMNVLEAWRKALPNDKDAINLIQKLKQKG